MKYRNNRKIKNTKTNKRINRKSFIKLNRQYLYN